MELSLGLAQTAALVRDRIGVSQRRMASLLQTSPQYLCKLEAGKSPISKKMINRYREVLGIDLHVLAWCEFGDHAHLPPATRVAAKRLSKVWMKEISGKLEQLKESLETTQEDFG